MWEVRTMSFDLGAMLKDVSNLDTSAERIQKIRLDLIDDDPENFYQLTGIEELANNIATCGLMDPIRVRKHPEKAGRYMIVSGHRRRSAVALLAKDDPEGWSEISCILQTDAVSPELQQLRLIYANSDTRRMTNAELSEQAEKVEKLLYALKEQGFDFPGRMRDHVAEACKISQSKLARLKVIKDKLDPLWQKPWKAGNLPESKAYALAQMPVDDQHLLGMHYASSPGDLRESMIRERGNTFAHLAGRSCDRRNGTPCINIERMREKAARSTAYYYEECHGCCFKCDKLATCQYACTMAADKKKEIKAQAKEKQQEEAKAREMRDRPKIQKLQQIYDRIGHLRQAKDIPAKQLLHICDRWYGPASEEKLQKLEQGKAEINTGTTLPFDYSFGIAAVQNLCAVADLLGCSIDYLLGHTDDPIWPPDVSSESTPVPATPGMWHYDYPPEPGCYIMMYEYKYSGETDITMSKWDGADWDEFDHFDDERFLCWAYEPPREPGAANSADVGWQTGDPSEVGTYIVICKYHPTAPEAVAQVFWDGDEWDHDYINEDVQILKWIRKPEEEAN